jgi:uncharacterized protein
MPRVIHFELLADDPQRALAFYQNVFGWKSHKWQGSMDYWFLTTGKDEEPGINGAIMSRTRKGSVYTTIDVPSIDKYLQKVKKAGGKVIMKKVAIPGVGFIAYCSDTEENTFGILQKDESIK